MRSLLIGDAPFLVTDGRKVSWLPPRNKKMLVGLYQPVLILDHHEHASSVRETSASKAQRARLLMVGK